MKISKYNKATNLLNKIKEVKSQIENLKCVFNDSDETREIFIHDGVYSSIIPKYMIKKIINRMRKHYEKELVSLEVEMQQL